MSEQTSLLQKTYIQKSLLFLLPLTGIKRDRYFKVTNTYLASSNLISKEYYENGISVEDQILIVTFSNQYKQKDREMYDQLSSKFKEIAKKEDIKPKWDDYEIELMSNPNFLAFHEASDEYIYTYDMSNWSADWNNFVNGKYSKFSEDAKSSIIDYRWTALTPVAQKKLHYYLYPYEEEARREFAKELQVSTKLLKEVRELCSKPNLALETYKCNVQKKQEDLDEVEN